jgi:hypothetical protein
MCQYEQVQLVIDQRSCVGAKMFNIINSRQKWKNVH